jgi:hypothetical protein
VSPLPAGPFQFSPAVLVDIGLEAVRQPGRGAFVRHIAGRAGHAGAAAIAAVRAFPRPPGMVLTNPSGIGAEDAFHGCYPAAAAKARQIEPGERKYTLELKVKILEQSPTAVYP